MGQRDVYFLLADGQVAEHLNDNGQLAMRSLLTDTISAEVKGRIAVLEAADDIRALALANNG